MSSKILITSPYSQMTKVIKELSAELEIPLIIVEGTMKEAALKVKQIVEGDPSIEVIISRAGTFVEISRLEINRPLIHCENSDFDILEALWNAKKMGSNIGFLGFQDKRFPYNLSMLSEIMGVPIQLYPYNSWPELVRQVEKASVFGIDVLVGGGIGAMEIIKKKKMKGLHVTTNRRTLQRSIFLAKDIAEYRTEAREKAKELNSIINISWEAIIVINNSARITYFNSAAETILKTPSINVIGMLVKDLSINSPLYQVLQEESKGIVSIFERKYLIEKLEIESDNNVIGKVYTLKEINKIQQLENNIRGELYKKGLVTKHGFKDILYKNAKVEKLILKAKIYSQTDSTILITGESGTGKELFAQGIHDGSTRSNDAFVAVNCASITDSLLESELFGYSDGAFTGAKKGGKPGFFELAHGGTIFLDEIGEISMKIQAMLLRVLQEKEIMRVGGDRLIPIDVRVVAATNKNLWENVQNGLFREDLFFRLNVLRLQLPPLRERKDDLPLLINHLLQQNKVVDLKWNNFPLRLKEFFLNYSWPGNIRQLKNVVERLSLNLNPNLTLNELIEEISYENTMVSTERDEKVILRPEYDSGSIVVPIGSLKEMESEIIKNLMQMHGNNRTLVAEMLGISRTTLWKKVKEY
ncbi:sigma 54-interacting transcriptional regulator [Peribacillus sp. NPDC097264]|uniref:sigma 54-interacting transcriptional regulator n=1 Tax=Peribacillus sp. NPDC097264 TaxID=3390616 RepID=UPI003D06E0F9